MACGCSGEHSTLNGGVPRVEDDLLPVIDLEMANWAETTLFPIILLLPLKVATEIRSARSYRILDRDEAVPVAILDWMRNDSRYSGLFK